MKKTQPKAKRTRTKKLMKPYEPTPAESAALEAARARFRARKPGPRMKITGDGALKVDHPDMGVGGFLFMDSIGTTSPDFWKGLVSQLVNVGSHGQEPDEDGINFMLAMVQGVEPRDQTEAMLATQMAAIHNATMKTARGLDHVETLEQRDSAANALNKLARTFTAQMEALKRYRSTGEQKVTVEHVTVNEGGQAIVGTVSHGGGVAKEKVDSTP